MPSLISGELVSRSFTLSVLMWMTTILPIEQIRGQELQSYTNRTSISIDDELPATPYPSTISVSGFTGEVVEVTITLQGLSHSYPDDIDILLAGPQGIKALVMSDAGGTFEIDNVVLTLSDAASRSLPNSSQIITGTYLPANWGSSVGDDFPPPAPLPPFTVPLSSFNGISPNGTWSLFIHDDIPDNSGSLENGWSLTIQTAPPTPPELTIRRSGSTAQISWPASATSFTLESRLKFGTDQPWFEVTNSVALTNGEQRVTVPLIEPQQFFRLRK